MEEVIINDFGEVTSRREMAEEEKQRKKEEREDFKNRLYQKRTEAINRNTQSLVGALVVSWLVIVILLAKILVTQ